MKIGLHSVSYLGLWYDGPALAPLELLRRTRQLGFAGVELDGRRPHGNPMDLDHARRRAIREMCAELELECVAIAAYNDFSSPVLEHRECQLLMLREHVRLARDLGAPVVRVFVAWPGVTLRDGLAALNAPHPRHAAAAGDGTWLEAWNRCKSCLREAVRFSEDEGVTLALANQPPVVRDLRDVLDMIAEVDSPWLRACVDAHALERQDAAGVHQAVLDAAPALVHSHYGGDFARRDDGAIEQRAVAHGRPATNYPAFVQALQETGYAGYLCYQLAHPALDARHQLRGVEHVDEQARLALEYMRGLVDHAAGRPAANPAREPDAAAV